MCALLALCMSPSMRPSPPPPPLRCHAAVPPGPSRILLRPSPGPAPRLPHPTLLLHLSATDVDVDSGAPAGPACGSWRAFPCRAGRGYGPPRAGAGAAASPEEPADCVKERTRTRRSTLQLAVVVGWWYAHNVVFNVYNKKTLSVFPCPWLLASLQLLAGSLWMAALWGLRLQPLPRVSRDFLAALLGPALFHAVGHISACVSFSFAAVSFTHVIKAAEPVFSVLLSAVLLRQFYPPLVWLSLLPIVGGCSLAAAAEPSFHPAGLAGALISNLGFVLRNLLSKQSLRRFSDIDGLNLYGCISVLSLIYLFPVAVLVEGHRWQPALRRALDVGGAPSANSFFTWLLLSGVFYHLYNQSSYEALDDVSPLTFSVANTMKRVVVIVASVLVFRNPITPLNILGSAAAILGTFLYSQAAATAKAAVANPVENDSNARS